MDKKFIINAPEESYICPPVFDEDFPKLSLSAIGILGQMMNVPELDYCTIDKLYNNNISDSIGEITDAVEELIDNGCVIKTQDNRLAIDKHLLTKMRIVSGYKTVTLEV